MRILCLAAVSLAVSAAAQEPTCRLEGQVLDPMLQPVVNAEIIVSLHGEVLARTRSDGSGAFVFGNLPQREVTLRATDAAPAVDGAWLDLLGLDRQFVSIRTVPARVVRGTARDTNGAPIPGAWVVSAPRSPAPLGVAADLVQAGADGTFTLTHVPVATNLVRVWAPDHDCWDGEVGGTGDLQVDCRLEHGPQRERSFSLTRASARQVADAHLVVVATLGGLPIPLPPPLRNPRADGGTWRILGWPIEDALTARVLLPDADTEPPWIRVPADRSGGDQRFRVVAPTRLRGRLQHDEALAGRWIVAVSLPDMVSRCFATLADDGTYDLASPAAYGQPIALRLLDPAMALVPQDPAQRGPWWVGTAAPELAEIAVAPARRVRLRVQRGDGAPSCGATVRIVAVADWDEGSDEHRDPAHLPAIAVGCTGLDGRIELAGLDLEPGTGLVCVIDGLAGRLATPFRVADQPVSDLGDLALEAGGALDVLCTGDALRGAGAPVTVTGPVGRRWQLVCDHRGHVRLEGLPTGRYHVSGMGVWLTADVRAPACSMVELRGK